MPNFALWYYLLSFLPLYATFGDLAHISRSQQCQTALCETFIFLSDLVETLMDC